MNDLDYGIDSHKLIYHVERVHEWMKGDPVYPIYIEVSPAAGCNQKCIFCGFDYINHSTRFLELKCWNKFIVEAARKGVKSVLFSGEGEPLFNKDICAFIENTKKEGIDAALATNGTLLTEDVSKKILRHLTWLRISLDAGHAETYSLIHRVKKEQFDLVVANIKKAVRIKRAYDYPVTIGIQFILLKENYTEVKQAVLLARRIGVDYFSVKPYSKHLLSVNKAGSGINYSRFVKLENTLQKYDTHKFKVIVRTGAMKKRASTKPYKRCLGLPFYAHIDSAGDIYPCGVFVGIKKYSFGNICRDSFSEIWEGDRRRSIMERYFAKMNASRCRERCRLDEINAYLWKLKNPPPHVNFI